MCIRDRNDRETAVKKVDIVPLEVIIRNVAAGSFSKRMGVEAVSYTHLYYYVLTQKKEIWNRSVAWYAFSQDTVTYRRLIMNSGTKPVLVKDVYKRQGLHH